MNYDALMAFAVFADHRNFTHAAVKLHISQPALHTKISKLAESVGTPLYVRQGRQLVLTEAGQLLATHAREVASLTEDTLALMSSAEKRGPVVLASGSGAFMHLLTSAILKARHGEYPVRLRTRNGAAAANDVREARAHVAVGVFGAAADELERQALRDVGQIVVMPNSHPLAARKRLTPKDLAGAELVIAPEGLPHRRATAAVLDEHGVKWTVAMEATGWDLMLRFVGYGIGIAVINDYVPVPNELVSVPISGFSTVRYEVAIRPDEPHDGARWLRDLIVDSV